MATISIDQFVQREVGHCVSHLVSTLASGYGNIGQNRPDNGLADLAEQACELAAPIEDWQSAAEEAGWQQNGSHFTRAGVSISYVDWQTLCDSENIEPHYNEVFEHWIVSDWLADKLIEHGEKVDKEFANLCIWARTTTGQGIAFDYVIERIYEEMINYNGEEAAPADA